MQEVQGIWIIGDTGNIIYSNEFFSPEIGGIEAALLGPMLSAIQSLAVDFGEELARRVSLGEMQIFMDKLNELKLTFAVRCESSIRRKRIESILDKILKLYEKSFQKIMLSRDKSTAIYTDFKQEINKLLKLDNNGKIDNLLENI